MRRLLWLLIVLAVLAAIVFGLGYTYLVRPVGMNGSSSEAPTVPCNGRVLTEGFTYEFRSPRSGELVAFHAKSAEGKIAPDAKSHDLAVVARVVGVPGDTVFVKRGHVYVDNVQFDDIDTPSFPKVSLGKDQYFVLGDNRTFSQDSRNFGPVPRDAIFGKVVLVYWPFGSFGGPQSRKAGAPPGQIAC